MIDCDVHNNWISAQDLKPYLSPFFRDYLERGEKPGAHEMPRTTRPWFHPEDYLRTDLTASNGGPPGSDFPLMKRALLDRYNLDFAILTAEEAIWVSTIANHHYASALASAYNDYMIAEWLSLDPRFKGSLVVAPQDPQGAAAEIRRVGAHPDIVQVLVTTGSYGPYGDVFYHPIWEAAAEMDLPIAAHLGGEVPQHNPISCGPTTYFWETHALLCQTGMAHVASVVANGVFEKWPNMSLVLVECGVAWLPSILWRLDSDFKALRKETPWVKRLPSEYARDHIRLTTQPLEQPANRDQLWSALEAMDGKNTLMYASDYPHWDFDDPNEIDIPPDWHENIFDLNARKLYKRLPEASPPLQEAQPA